MTWYRELSLSLGSNPRPEEAFACGSASMIKTFFSRTPRAAARLTEVVVLPTPPFWLAIEIIFAFYKLYRFRNVDFTFRFNYQ